MTAVVAARASRWRENTNYWKGQPARHARHRKLEFRVIPDQETQIAEMMTGGVDGRIWRVQADQAKQLETVPNLKVLAAETMRVGFLQLDARASRPAPRR